MAGCPRGHWLGSVRCVPCGVVQASVCVSHIEVDTDGQRLIFRWQADKGQAGLAQAWLESVARDADLTPGPPPPASPALDGFTVEIQTLPSQAADLAGKVVSRFGGRALAFGGLGTVLARVWGRPVEPGGPPLHRHTARVSAVAWVVAPLSVWRG